MPPRLAAGSIIPAPVSQARLKGGSYEPQELSIYWIGQKVHMIFSIK